MSAPTVEFGHGSLNPTLTQQFNALPQQGKVLAEYVWIGGTGLDYRCKTKVLDGPTSIEDLPVWNYDGSSTGQAPGHDSEVLIKPAAVFKDPFRGGDNILVLCETYQPTGPGQMKPLQLEVPADSFGLDGNNSRAAALEIFENPKVKAQKPWYGIEQEYTLFYKDGKIPLGWPADGSEPGAQGPYYCSAGVENSFGRDIADAHLKACLAAGVTIAGTNGEVMPGQWEYQIGPCEGIDCGDHMIMSRYLLNRVCEAFGVLVTFHPKPMATGDWNGAGCHTNFSTLDMRSPDTKFDYTPTDGPYAGKALKGGFAKIIEACDKFGKAVKEHIDIYGPFNDLRLTGKHETASIKDFSYGVANRGASIRIPRDTEAKGYGYLEDRRPASNMDPYKVSALVAKTALL